MSGAIWFFGTGFFAARCLENIASSNRPELVVTAPPSVAGRGLKTKPSPVEETALRLNLTLRHSDSVNRDEELLALFAERRPDAILVIDFGQKVGQPWLNGVKYGCINIHPSLLPKYRGAAPVQRAVIDGQRETGVTLFRLVEKMDAGPIWQQTRTLIGENETAGELFERLADEGCSLFEKNAGSLFNGEAVFLAQDDAVATLAPKIDKTEARIDPSLPSKKIHDLVRGLQPAPGAYFEFRGKRVKVLKTLCCPQGGESGELFVREGTPCLACGDGSVALLLVQPEGKKPMDGSSWLKGIRLVSHEKINQHQSLN